MVKKKKNNKIKESMSGRIYSIYNGILLTGIALLMLYPMLNVLAVSLSDYYEYLKTPWMIIPKEATFEGYQYVLDFRGFWRGYVNTIIIVIGGTVWGLLVTILTAYPLSRPQLKGKTFFMALVIFTMVFSAGMIPCYLNIKSLGLLNTFWALFIPSAFSAFNCILMLNFFKEIPVDLIEAAQIDGGTEPYILFKIVVPLSRAVIASITLFLAVGYWNGYFDAQIYLKDRELWPLALILKEMLLAASMALAEAEKDPMAAQMDVATTTIQYASIIVSTLPIICVYPFLQKYFAKGVMVGGVKG